jgi:hypothetical protein
VPSEYGVDTLLLLLHRCSRQLQQCEALSGARQQPQLQLQQQLRVGAMTVQLQVRSSSSLLVMNGCCKLPRIACCESDLVAAAGSEEALLAALLAAAAAGFW